MSLGLRKPSERLRHCISNMIQISWKETCTSLDAQLGGHHARAAVPSGHVCCLQAANLGICMQLLSLCVACKGKEEVCVMVQEAMVDAAGYADKGRRPTSSSSGPESSSTLAAPGVLQVAAAGGRYSRFFGQSEVSCCAQMQRPPTRGCTLPSVQLRSFP